MTDTKSLEVGGWSYSITTLSVIICDNWWRLRSWWRHRPYAYGWTDFDETWCGVFAIGSWVMLQIFYFRRSVTQSKRMLNFIRWEDGHPRWHQYTWFSVTSTKVICRTDIYQRSQELFVPCELFHSKSMLVCCAAMPCGIVGRFQHFGGKYCFRL